MVSISDLEALQCDVPSHVLEKLRQDSCQLEMIPEAATEALRLVNDPSCKISLVASTISRDVSLASNILKIANSVLYSPGRAIVSVQEAVVHVGFHQCRNLILASCAKGMMQNSETAPEFSKKDLIEHSLLTAEIASLISRELRLGFQGEDYAAGLLHDIGRLLLAVVFPERSKELNEIYRGDSEEILRKEIACFETDHATLGCHFAISNRIPATLAEAIRFHHTPEEAKLHRLLTVLVSVADELAHAMVHSEREYAARQLPAFAAVAGTACAEQLETQVERILEIAQSCSTTL